jgi:choline transporter-like protein 2/4/5
MANGPVQDRACTDILCCLIFVIFLIGMGGVTGYGLIFGNPSLLMTAWDYNGNGCGYNSSTKEFPFLYYPAIDYESLK